ncbi:MAG: polymer-forming cytoskeletal protein [Thermoanaerobaculia bacterium]
MAIFSKETAVEKPPAAAGDTTPQVPGAPSFLGPGVVFEGTLSGAENVAVEGRFSGRIDLKSGLRIGSHARVEADIHARTILIEGTVVGEVAADEKVELVTSANVDGNIKAPKIVVAEGARFRGAVDMGTSRPKE